MKVSKFLKPSGNEFIPGDFNVIDDVSGFKVKASETVKQWNGFRTSRPLKRNEQDFLRAHKEKIRTPWARPESDNTYIHLDPDGSEQAYAGTALWQPTTSYTLGDPVLHNNISYTAASTHTSTGFFDFTKWTRA